MVLEIILRPNTIEDLKDDLNNLGVNGMTVTTVLRNWSQKGIKEIYGGTVLKMLSN